MTRLTVIFLLGASLVAAQTYSGLSCSTNKTDAYCKSMHTSTDVQGSICCATIVTQTRTSLTASFTNSSTNYECLPTELAMTAGNVSISNYTKLIYSCGTTTTTDLATCTDGDDSSCMGETKCCASRSYRVSNTSDAMFGTNACVTRANSSVTSFAYTFS